MLYTLNSTFEIRIYSLSCRSHSVYFLKFSFRFRWLLDYNLVSHFQFFCVFALLRVFEFQLKLVSYICLDIIYIVVPCCLIIVDSCLLNGRLKRETVSIKLKVKPDIRHSSETQNI